MRYVLEQKLLSWGDDYTIRDEQGADRFVVDEACHPDDQGHD